MSAQIPDTELEEEKKEQPPTPSQARGTTKRRTGCPDLFPVTDAMRRFVTDRNIPNDVASHETQRFLDYHRAKGSLFIDWHAAWRTWMGKVARDVGTPATAPTGQREENLVRGVNGVYLDSSLV